MGQKDRAPRQGRRCTAAPWLFVALLVLSACRPRFLTRTGIDLAGPPPAPPPVAAEVLPPETGQPVADAAIPFDEPMRLRNRRDLDPWDLSLQEAVFLALSHAEVIRQNSQFLAPNNPLLRSPDGTPTIYDPSLQQSGVLFGQRGVEAALSDFDTQFTTRMVWGNNEQIQNNPFTAGGLPAGATLDEDTAQFQAAIRKQFATGGQIGLSHSWNYSSNNSLGRLFPSAYDGNVKAEFRQPLLAGAGADVTRISGPVSDDIQGVTGVQQGVLIAKINGDITLTDFEINVTTFLRDVERQYWQLYVAYRSVEAEIDGLKAAREVYDVVKVRSEAGAPGGGEARLVEAREGVLQSEQRSFKALDDLYAAEAQMRLLMGLPVNDGRFLRPIERPISAEISYHWESSLGEALVRRPELRRQKWVVKSEQLQLSAAENLARPRFDFVASGQANGFGNDLVGPVDAPGTNRELGSAYHRLMGLGETGWTAGFEYSQALGRRYVLTQVRNHEIRVAKALKILQAQETEISHELAAAFRDVDRTWIQSGTQQALVKNSRLRVEVARQEYVANRDGTAFLSLDALNRARDTLTQAETNAARSQVEYTLALTEIEYRCGRLLQCDNVTLQEGPHTTRPQVRHLPIPEHLPWTAAPDPEEFRE